MKDKGEGEGWGEGRRRQDGSFSRQEEMHVRRRPWTGWGEGEIRGRALCRKDCRARAVSGWGHRQRQ